MRIAARLAVHKAGFSHSHLVKEHKEEIPKVNTACAIKSGFTCNWEPRKKKCCLAKHVEMSPPGLLGSKGTAINTRMFFLVETVGHWQFATGSSPCPSPWEKLVPLTQEGHWWRSMWHERREGGTRDCLQNYFSFFTPRFANKKLN